MTDHPIDPALREVVDAALLSVPFGQQADAAIAAVLTYLRGLGSDAILVPSDGVARKQFPMSMPPTERDAYWCCHSRGADLYHAALAVAKRDAKNYALLREAINESAEACTPQCDSFGHAEDCKTYDAATMLIKQQAENADLRARLAETEKQRDYFYFAAIRGGAAQ